MQAIPQVRGDTLPAKQASALPTRTLVQKRQTQQTARQQIHSFQAVGQRASHAKTEYSEFTVQLTTEILPELQEGCSVLPKWWKWDSWTTYRILKYIRPYVLTRNKCLALCKQDLNFVIAQLLHKKPVVAKRALEIIGYVAKHRVKLPPEALRKLAIQLVQRKSSNIKVKRNAVIAIAYAILNGEVLPACSKEGAVSAHASPYDLTQLAGDLRDAISTEMQQCRHSPSLMQLVVLVLAAVAKLGVALTIKERKLMLQIISAGQAIENERKSEHWYATHAVRTAPNESTRVWHRTPSDEIHLMKQHSKNQMPLAHKDIRYLVRQATREGASVRRKKSVLHTLSNCVVLGQYDFPSKDLDLLWPFLHGCLHSEDARLRKYAIIFTAYHLNSPAQARQSLRPWLLDKKAQHELQYATATLKQTALKALQFHMEAAQDGDDSAFIDSEKKAWAIMLAKLKTEDPTDKVRSLASYTHARLLNQYDGLINELSNATTRLQALKLLFKAANEGCCLNQEICNKLITLIDPQQHVEIASRKLSAAILLRACEHSFVIPGRVFKLIVAVDSTDVKLYLTQAYSHYVRQAKPADVQATFKALAKFLVDKVLLHLDGDSYNFFRAPALASITECIGKVDSVDAASQGALTLLFDNLAEIYVTLQTEEEKKNCLLLMGHAVKKRMPLKKPVFDFLLLLLLSDPAVSAYCAERTEDTQKDSHSQVLTSTQQILLIVYYYLQNNSSNKTNREVVDNLIQHLSQLFIHPDQRFADNCRALLHLYINQAQQPINASMSAQLVKYIGVADSNNTSDHAAIILARCIESGTPLTPAMCYARLNAATPSLMASLRWIHLPDKRQCAINAGYVLNLAIKPGMIIPNLDDILYAIPMCQMPGDEAFLLNLARVLHNGLASAVERQPNGTGLRPTIAPACSIKLAKVAANRCFGYTLRDQCFKLLKLISACNLRLPLEAFTLIQAALPSDDEEITRTALTIVGSQACHYNASFLAQARGQASDHDALMCKHIGALLIRILPLFTIPHYQATLLKCVDSMCVAGYKITGSTQVSAAFLDAVANFLLQGTKQQMHCTASAILCRATHVSSALVGYVQRLEQANQTLCSPSADAVKQCLDTLYEVVTSGKMLTVNNISQLQVMVESNHPQSLYCIKILAFAAENGQGLTLEYYPLLLAKLPHYATIDAIYYTLKTLAHAVSHETVDGSPLFAWTATCLLHTNTIDALVLDIVKLGLNQQYRFSVAVFNRLADLAATTTDETTTAAITTLFEMAQLMDSDFATNGQLSASAKAMCAHATIIALFENTANWNACSRGLTLLQSDAMPISPAIVSAILKVLAYTVDTSDDDAVLAILYTLTHMQGKIALPEVCLAYVAQLTQKNKYTDAAIKVLGETQKHNLPPPVISALCQAMCFDPNNTVREKLYTLLKHQPKSILTKEQAALLLAETTAQEAQPTTMDVAAFRRFWQCAVESVPHCSRKTIAVIVEWITINENVRASHLQQCQQASLKSSHAKPLALVELVRTHRVDIVSVIKRSLLQGNEFSAVIHCLQTMVNNIHYIAEGEDDCGLTTLLETLRMPAERYSESKPAQTGLQASLAIHCIDTLPLSSAQYLQLESLVLVICQHCFLAACRRQYADQKLKAQLIFLLQQRSPSLSQQVINYFNGMPLHKAIVSLFQVLVYTIDANHYVQSTANANALLEALMVSGLNNEFNADTTERAADDLLAAIRFFVSRFGTALEGQHASFMIKLQQRCRAQQLSSAATAYFLRQLVQANLPPLLVLQHFNQHDIAVTELSALVLAIQSVSCSYHALLSNKLSFQQQAFTLICRRLFTDASMLNSAMVTWLREYQCKYKMSFDDLHQLLRRFNGDASQDEVKALLLLMQHYPQLEARSTGKVHVAQTLYQYRSTIIQAKCFLLSTSRVKLGDDNFLRSECSLQEQMTALLLAFFYDKCPPWQTETVLSLLDCLLAIMRRNVASFNLLDCLKLLSILHAEKTITEQAVIDFQQRHLQPLTKCDALVGSFRRAVIDFHRQLRSPVNAHPKHGAVRDRSHAELLAVLKQLNPTMHIRQQKNYANFLASVQQHYLDYSFTYSITVPAGLTAQTIECSSPVLSEWNKEHIELWLKNKPSPPLALYLAVMKRACALHFGPTFQLRPAQILAIALLYEKNHDKGRLAKIATGEGKSVIIALYAILQAKKHQQSVDIITSAPDLAERDADELKALYALFGVTVASNKDHRYTEGEKKCYRADVVYGTTSQFQFDKLRHEYYNLNTRGERKYGFAIIDEVDSMLVDKGDEITMLSRAMPGMDALNPLFIALWSKVEERVAYCQQQGILEPALLLIEARAFCNAFCDRNNNENKNRQQPKVTIPAYMQAFVEKHYQTWVENALVAYFNLEQGQQYTIEKDPVTKRQCIKPIDYQNTGVTQNSTRWGEGLHQFLQIKHGLRITPLTLVTNYCSNLAYLRSYGSRLGGVTGTIGSKSNQALLREQYNLDIIDVPRFRNNQLKHYEHTIHDTRDNWLTHVSMRAMTEADLGRAVLILCETQEEAQQFSALLRQHHQGTVKEYIDSNSEQRSFTKNVVLGGTIIVATNLGGRGLDIKFDKKTEQKGGLHVCFTFLPQNSRTQEQGFGRAARKGEQGSAEIVLCREALNAVDGKTVDDVLSVRDNQEAERLTQFRKKHLPLMRDKDSLFEAFREFRTQLKKTQFKSAALKSMCGDLDDADASKLCAEVHHAELPFILDAVEERWGIWLAECNFNESTANISAIINKFNKFKSAILSDINQGNVITNPAYLIDIGNYFLGRAKTKIGKLQFWKNYYALATQAYDKAIALDPGYAIVAYYNKALALIKSGEEDYKKKALALLKLAQKQAETIAAPLYHDIASLYNGYIATRSKTNAYPDLSEQLSSLKQYYAVLVQSIQLAITEIEASQKCVDITLCTGKDLNQHFHVDYKQALEHIACHAKPTTTVDLALTHLHAYRDFNMKYQVDKVISALPNDAYCTVEFSAARMKTVDKQAFRNYLSILYKTKPKPEKPEVTDEKFQPQRERLCLGDDVGRVKDKVYNGLMSAGTYIKSNVADAYHGAHDAIEKKWFDYSSLHKLAVALSYAFHSPDDLLAFTQAIEAKSINKAQYTLRLSHLRVADAKKLKALCQYGRFQLVEHCQDNTRKSYVDVPLSDSPTLPDTATLTLDLCCKDINECQTIIKQLKSILEDKSNEGSESNENNKNNEASSKVVCGIKVSGLSQKNADALLNFSNLPTDLAYQHCTPVEASNILKMAESHNAEGALYVKNLSVADAQKCLMVMPRLMQNVQAYTQSMRTILASYNLSPETIDELLMNGQAIFFNLSVVTPTPWKTVALLVALSSAELATGLVLSLATAGIGIPLGYALIMESACDASALFKIGRKKQVNLTHHFLMKSLRLTLAAATGAVAVTKAAQTVSHLTRAQALTRNTLYAAGNRAVTKMSSTVIQQGAKNSIRTATSQIKHVVSKHVTDYFNDPAWSHVLHRVLVVDAVSGDRRQMDALKRRMTALINALAKKDPLAKLHMIESFQTDFSLLLTDIKNDLPGLESMLEQHLINAGIKEQEAKRLSASFASSAVSKAGHLTLGFDSASSMETKHAIVESFVKDTLSKSSMDDAMQRRYLQVLSSFIINYSTADNCDYFLEQSAIQAIAINDITRNLITTVTTAARLTAASLQVAATPAINCGYHALDQQVESYLESANSSDDIIPDELSDKITEADAVLDAASPAEHDLSNAHIGRIPRVTNVPQHGTGRLAINAHDDWLLRRRLHAVMQRDLHAGTHISHKLRHHGVAIRHRARHPAAVQAQPMAPSLQPLPSTISSPQLVITACTDIANIISLGLHDAAQTMMEQYYREQVDMFRVILSDHTNEALSALQKIKHRGEYILLDTIEECILSQYTAKQCTQAVSTEAIKAQAQALYALCMESPHQGFAIVCKQLKHDYHATNDKKTVWGTLAAAFSGYIKLMTEGYTLSQQQYCRLVAPSACAPVLGLQGLQPKLQHYQALPACYAQSNSASVVVNTLSMASGIVSGLSDAALQYQKAKTALDVSDQKNLALTYQVAAGIVNYAQQTQITVMQTLTDVQKSHIALVGNKNARAVAQEQAFGRRVFELIRAGEDGAADTILKQVNALTGVHVTSMNSLKQYGIAHDVAVNITEAQSRLLEGLSTEILNLLKPLSQKVEQNKQASLLTRCGLLASSTDNDTFKPVEGEQACLVPS